MVQRIEQHLGQQAASALIPGPPNPPSPRPPTEVADEAEADDAQLGPDVLEHWAEAEKDPGKLQVIKGYKKWAGQKGEQEYLSASSKRGGQRG